MINVTIDGVTYSVTTDSLGVWTLSYTPATSGNYTATVSWTGSDSHNGFRNSTNFNVLKRNIVVDLTVEENDDGSVTVIANATYEDDGSPASGYPVDFYLDGEVVGSGITDKNGIASITIPADKVGNGTHTITAVLSGNEQSSGSEVSIEFIRTQPDPIDPDPDPVDNPTIELSNNPAANAAMKKTGMPITILLIIVLSLLFCRRKK